jgi:UDPglucose 6-dehydrogenase
VKIGFVGLGKLGLPVALAIDSKGHDVFAHDLDDRVKGYLETGSIPYREKDLSPLLANHKIKWCDDIQTVVRQSDLVFVAIQTPHEPEYEGDTLLPITVADFDYSFLRAGIETVAQACASLGEPRTVAIISTCLPGTFQREIRPVLNEYVHYVYTPLFIAMGTVLQDYLYPEFNLLGVENDDAAKVMEDFYETINDCPAVLTDVTTAEGIKVSYNTWITAKTVISNAWGEMCERLAMNFNDMKRAWDLSDKRLISTRYMSAGMSDGGGCHPRDNIALAWLAEYTGMSHNIWDDLMTAREDYEFWHAELAAGAADEFDLPLVLLGRAFKPETDIETGSAAVLMANILTNWAVDFVHVNDIASDELYEAVYFIATKNERYRGYQFPAGSVVLDPFGYIDSRPGIIVKRLGRQ